MKKILVTSTDCMMYLFLMPHVKYLANKNYIVDILNKFEGKNFNYSYNHSFTKEELLDMIFIDDKEEALLKYIEETKN